MQPGDIVELNINCRAVSKTGVWRSYTAGKETKLRDFAGQVVLMPIGRLQLSEVQPGPNADGPGEGPMDESERKTQEAIGAFMAERGEYEREFSAGLTENVGTTNEF